MRGACPDMDIFSREAGVSEPEGAHIHTAWPLGTSVSLPGLAHPPLPLCVTGYPL